MLVRRCYIRCFCFFFSEERIYMECDIFPPLLYVQNRRQIILQGPSHLWIGSNALFFQPYPHGKPKSLCYKWLHWKRCTKMNGVASQSSKYACFLQFPFLETVLTCGLLSTVITKWAPPYPAAVLLPIFPLNSHS